MMSRYQDDPEYREQEKKKSRERYRNNKSVQDITASRFKERYYNESGFKEKRNATRNAGRKKRLLKDEDYKNEQQDRLKILRGIKSTPEALKRGRKRHKVKVKAEVYAALGSRCACCGEDNQEFLSVDHIHGDGKIHRALIGNSPQALYKAIKDEGFPKDKYRILCMNCNFATRYGQPCPHELELKKVLWIVPAS
jgi:hypothetical protein